MAYSKNRRLAEIVSDTSGNLSVEGIVVPTQSNSDNDTSAASTAFVHAHIDAVLDSAPGTLNTLNEIAAALNDDANFNATVTNAIAAKLPLSGGTLTGDTSITKSGNPVFMVKTTGAGNNPVLRLQADTNKWDLQGTFSNTNDELFFMYNSSTKMTIDKNGQVGIGVTPRAKLDVYQQTNRTSQTGAARGVLHLQDGDTPSSNELTAITFESNSNNASSIIGQSLTNSGSFLFFGTSNSYAAGVTNTAMTINHVGTVSAASHLHVAGNLDVVGQIGAYNNSNSSWGTMGLRATDYTFKNSGGTVRANLTSLGRLGLATTTNYAGNAMAYQLTIDSEGASGSIFEAHRTANSRVEMYQNATGGYYIDALGSTPFLQLRTGGADRLLIDNAGRHYIGKGASNLATSGIELNPGGYLQVTESQSPALYLSRLTDDGNIINFYKTSSLMGQIGTYGGTLYIGGGTGSNSSGLMFNGADIEPTTGGTGRADGAIDLGSGNFRFQHIRFSGGLYGGSELQLSRVGVGTAAGSSVAAASSNTEGIFWHNSTGDYNIGRTPGSWSGPNYTQLKLDWDTGIIIDGGTAYGKSGVEINGPIKSSHGGLVLQTLEAYNNTAISTSGSGVLVVESAFFPVFADSRIVVWFNSGQVSSPGNASNPNFTIQWENSSGTSTVISDQNSNHYWYDIGKNSGARVNMTGQALSGLLSADTYKIRVIGNVYNGTCTWNYQAQGAHLLIQEIAAG